MKNGIATILALVAMLLSMPALAHDDYPRDLKLVGDHWTAWDPPTSFAEGSQIYTIERGDTLWDLAARFYGDPYLWPQLWEQNSYILDAHWIYPGDPLVTTVQVTPIEELTAIDEGSGDGTGAAGDGEDGMANVQSADDAARPPAPLGSESDIYCSGFVGGLNEPFDFKIVGSEYEALSPVLSGDERGRIEGIYGRADTLKYDLDARDIVYLDGGLNGGLGAGDILTIVESTKKVRHPLTRKVVGRLYRYQGRLQVLSVQEDTAIAEITHSCSPIYVGSNLMPFQPEPVPLGRDSPLRPINYPESIEDLAGSPVILLSDDEIVTLGEDHVVYIDQGEDKDILPGDVYTIYRTNRPGLPLVVLGELAVLSVHETTAVGKIIKSRHTVYIGDRLSLK